MRREKKAVCSCLHKCLRIPCIQTDCLLYTVILCVLFDAVCCCVAFGMLSITSTTMALTIRQLPKECETFENCFYFIFVFRRHWLTLQETYLSAFDCCFIFGSMCLLACLLVCLFISSFLRIFYLFFTPNFCSLMLLLLHTLTFFVCNSEKTNSWPEILIDYHFVNDFIFYFTFFFIFLKNYFCVWLYAQKEIINEWY